MHGLVGGPTALSGSPVPQRETEVVREVGRLTTVCSELLGIVDRLGGRLSPVMVPMLPPTTEKVPANDSPTSTDLGAAVAGCRRDVERALMAIDSYLGRLEV